MICPNCNKKIGIIELNYVKERIGRLKRKEQPMCYKCFMKKKRGIK